MSLNAKGSVRPSAITCSITAARSPGRSRSGHLSSSRLSPIRATSLAEETAAVIRERILSGDFAPGSRLIEAQLASQLEISRAPVREALAQLRAEGLVQDSPRRGAFVAALTAADVHELYELRAALETRALKLLFKRNREELRRTLDSRLQAMERAARRAKHGQLARLDFEFHETLCRLSGNRRLHQAFLTHGSLVQVLLAVEEREFYRSSAAVADDHRALARTLLGTDLRRAERALEAHLAEAEARLSKLTAVRTTTAE